MKHPIYLVGKFVYFFLSAQFSSAFLSWNTYNRGHCANIIMGSAQKFIGHPVDKSFCKNVSSAPSLSSTQLGKVVHFWPSQLQNARGILTTGNKVSLEGAYATLHHCLRLKWSLGAHQAGDRHYRQASGPAVWKCRPSSYYMLYPVIILTTFFHGCLLIIRVWALMFHNAQWAGKKVWTACIWKKVSFVKLSCKIAFYHLFCLVLRN